MFEMPGTIVVEPPSIPGAILVPTAGPAGAEGPIGTIDGGGLQVIEDLIDSTVQAHVDAAEPHPAYDDLPSLVLLFENGLI